MQLRFTRLPATTRGIYTVGGVIGRLPPRFLLLYPEVAESFRALEAETGGLVYSDIRRTAMESLQAIRSKAGVQAPSHSGHNFGFSVDVAIEETQALYGWTYAVMRAKLENHGWYCYRRDGKIASEAWHFSATSPHRDGEPWSAPMDRMIEATYGSALRLDLRGIQAGLAKMHLYPGAIDGLNGPLTQRAWRAYQRAWYLPPTDTNDVESQRLLAFVTADVVVYEGLSAVPSLVVP